MTANVSEAAASAQGWRTCGACGQWQRAASGAACAGCEWPRLLVVGPGNVRAENAVRVLVEAELRSDGTWHLSGFKTARLPEALDHAGLLQRVSQNGAGILSRGSHGAGGGALPSVP
jgi:hypothetical protein